MSLTLPCKCGSWDGHVSWQSGAREYYKVTLSIAALLWQKCYSSSPGNGFREGGGRIFQGDLRLMEVCGLILGQAQKEWWNSVA